MSSFRRWELLRCITQAVMRCRSASPKGFPSLKRLASGAPRSVFGTPSACDGRVRQRGAEPLTEGRPSGGPGLGRRGRVSRFAICETRNRGRPGVVPSEARAPSGIPDYQARAERRVKRSRPRSRCYLRLGGGKRCGSGCAEGVLPSENDALR